MTTSLQPSTQPQVSSVLPSQLPRSQSQDHRKDDSTSATPSLGDNKKREVGAKLSQRPVLQDCKKALDGKSSKKNPLAIKKSRTAVGVDEDSENIDIGSRPRKRKADDDIDEVELKVFDPSSCKIVGPCREYALVSSRIDKDGTRYTSDIIAWGSFLTCFGKRR